MEPTQSVHEARRAVDEGVSSIKIKIGAGRERDTAVVAAVADAIGDKVKLALDANGGYADTREAIEVVHSLQRLCDLYYVEQPVRGIRNLAVVARSVDVPILADESAWTLSDVEDIFEEKAARGVSAYVTKPGGLLEASEILDYCLAHEIMCNVNGSCETGVGNAANIHLAVSGRALNLPSVIPLTNIRGQEQTRVAGFFYTDDIIRRRFEFKGGKLFVPSGPGLGVELDYAKLDEYRSVYYPETVSI